MNRYFTILIFTTLSLMIMPTCQAQTPKVTVSYLGGYISNPGLKVGYTKPFKTNISTNKKNRAIQTEWSYGASVGTYVHRRNHTSVQLIPEVAYTHTRGKGFQLGASFGAGFQRTFIPKSYQVNEVNEIERNRFAGQNLFAINPAIRLGKQVKDKPVAWFIKPQVMFSAPYFGGMNTYALIEAGVSYSL